MKTKYFLWIFVLIWGIVSVEVHAQAIPNSTKSNEVLKLLLPRLNLQGEWITLRFSDGTEMSTGSSGDMSAATYDPQTIAGDAFNLSLHTGSIAHDSSKITGTGTNSHAIIDTHLADSTNPHGATLTQTNATIAGVAAPYIAQTNGTGTGIILASATVTTGTVTTLYNTTFSGSVGTFTSTLGVNGISGIVDSDIPNTITLDNITQITSRAHDDITGTGTNSHSTIDTHLADTSDPHGASITQTNISVTTGTVTTLYNTTFSGSVGTFTGTLGVNGISGIVDGDIPGTITLDNITQITTRSHTSLSDIGTNAHTAIDSHIADTSDPHSATLTQTAATIAGVAAPYIAQTSGTGTGITLAGDTIFPGGIWNSSGNVGIGTANPAGALEIKRAAVDSSVFARIWNTDASGSTSDAALILAVGSSTGSGDPKILYDTQLATAWLVGVDTSDGSKFKISLNSTADLAINTLLTINSSGNIGIGTSTPSNILTLPIGSPDDPIADAWTLHCLAAYKDIGTETAEMIQTSANDKIKSVPVSSFTKKAIIADEEAERAPKQKYQDKIRESAKADLELYTAETGVAMNNNSYVDELVNSMWETKADRQTLVEANKQKLIAEKKALPKFQRKNYGIVAEDAPAEAQVLREDGSLQGVDPYALVGILWANAQKQDERISQLETQIVALTSRVNVLETAP